MSEFVICVDDLNPSAEEVWLCRFCFEGGYSTGLEAPCSCSGTIKLAHRDCVQRWCDEKGNTTCEICLQNFEPGYTCPPKKPQPIVTTPIIRTNTETRRRNEEEENGAESHDCASIPDSTASSVSRNMALIVSFFLLIMNTFAVLCEETHHSPFPITVVVIAKACGVIIPMYILYHIASTIETSIRHYYHYHQNSDEERGDT